MWQYAIHDCKYGPMEYFPLYSCGSKPFFQNLKDERNHNTVASGVGKHFGRPKVNPQSLYSY